MLENGKVQPRRRNRKASGPLGRDRTRPPPLLSPLAEPRILIGAPANT
jgi:hypothetical protein